MTATTAPERRTTAPAIALTLAIAALALSSAYIHAGLGGLLFTLNAVGYVCLAAAVVAVLIPHPLTRRFAWLPLIALAAYTATTIGAYLVMGPYFTLGWIAKAIEVVLLALIAIDLGRRFGSPAGLFREARGSLRGITGGLSAG